MMICLADWAAMRPRVSPGRWILMTSPSRALVSYFSASFQWISASGSLTSLTTSLLT